MRVPHEMNQTKTIVDAVHDTRNITPLHFTIVCASMLPLRNVITISDNVLKFDIARPTKNNNMRYSHIPYSCAHEISVTPLVYVSYITHHTQINRGAISKSITMQQQHPAAIARRFRSILASRQCEETGGCDVLVTQDVGWGAGKIYNFCVLCCAELKFISHVSDNQIDVSYEVCGKFLSNFFLLYFPPA